MSLRNDFKRANPQPDHKSCSLFGKIWVHLWLIKQVTQHLKRENYDSK